MWCAWSLRDLIRDTAGDHRRVIDPAEPEGSENNRAQERGHRHVKARARAKAKVGESSLKRPFQFKKYTVVIQKKAHFSWALDCGAAKSWSRPAALLAEACWKRGCKAGDDRKVEAVEGETLSWNRRTCDHVIHQVTSVWSSRRTRSALRTTHHGWQHATIGWK